jgi:hypothetical protein
MATRAVSLVDEAHLESRMTGSVSPWTLEYVMRAGAANALLPWLMFLPVG